MLHFLTTVTPLQAPVHFSHEHHTSPSTDTLFKQLLHLPEDCHTSWKLSHLSTPLFIPPWPSHLDNNWQTFLIPHLPYDCHTSWQLSHLPKDLYISPMTITPLHHLTHLSYTWPTSLRTATLTDNYHTSQPPYIFPMTITPSHQLPHHFNTFHTSVRTGILPDNCQNSPSLLTSPPLPSHLPTNYHTSLVVTMHPLLC